MKPDYFDIHSHLNFSAYDTDREEVIARMREKKVWTITVGTDVETSREAVTLAEKHEGFFATVGVHPTDIEEGFNEKEYDVFAQHEKVVAIGECGLDYFRLSSEDSRSKERQKEIFEKQIVFAQKHHLPLMIHARPSRGSMDAYEDVLAIVSTLHIPHSTFYPGNVHFFVGDTDIAKRFLEMGFTVSFDGPITFTREYDEVVKYVPLHMLHAETDAPFAAPTPHRGKRNEPAFVSEVVKAIATIRGEDFEKVREALVQNAFRCFKVAQ